jgi:hypothetical protein
MFDNAFWLESDCAFTLINVNSCPYYCGKLPYGGFASSDRASAQAPRSDRVWEAAVWGATGRRTLTLATWPAPANFQGFQPQGESRRSCTSLTTARTPRAVRTPLCPISIWL